MPGTYSGMTAKNERQLCCDRSLHSPSFDRRQSGGRDTADIIEYSIEWGAQPRAATRRFKRQEQRDNHREDSAAAAGLVGDNRRRHPVRSLERCGAGAATQSLAATQPPTALDDNALASSSSQSGVAAGSPRRLSAEGGPPLQPRTSEHPLTPVLRWAKEGLPAIENLKDYSATLAKRERIRGKLGNYEYLFIKIRHTPLSVYACFLAPLRSKGRKSSI